MDQKSEKALCPNKPREIKIGKTTYIINANYAHKMTLFQKLLWLMKEELRKDNESQRKGEHPSDT